MSLELRARNNKVLKIDPTKGDADENFAENILCLSSHLFSLFRDIASCPVA